MQKAIQFIGTQRSGSNLLRVMLHQHPEICAPHPPHILQQFMPFLPMYGDLQIDSNFEHLVEDVCRLVELNPVNWNIHFDRKQVIARCENASLPQVMKALYELKAESKHALYWCCKSMASIHYVNEMEAANIHPFYIFIYRDGRDVALSFLNAIVGEKHVYHLAQHWKEEQELSMALCEKVGDKRCIKICYEEFVGHPEPILKTICEKLRIDYSPIMLQYTESEESKETAASGKMWANLVKPVMKNNTKKFLTGLNRDEIKLFEQVAGQTLQALCYSLEFPLAMNEKISDEEIRTFNGINVHAKEQSRKLAAKEDLEKRAAQDTFITQLKTQFTQFKAVVS